MRTVLSVTTAAVLLSANHVSGFAPISPGMVTETRSSLRPNKLMQRNMVMDRPDPLDLESSSNNKSTDPTPVLASFFQNTENASKMKVAAAAMAMALTVLPMNSDAAMSGGRMGGSYSSPAPTRSYSAPSRSYSSGYSSGYTSGYMSRPAVTIGPRIGYGYSPFYSPMPGYFGGPGVISYSRGPSFFDLIFFGGFAFVLFNFFRNATETTVSSSPFAGTWESSSVASALGSGTSVVQLSVAMEVPNRDDRNSILGALDNISSTARTDSRVGIQNLTSQVALELLRRRSSITAAWSSYNHFGDRNGAKREFETRSIKERSKFEKETVNKYGGVDYSARSGARGGDDGGKATMAVVTLVLAIDGDSTKLPKIRNMSDVEEALRKIASDSKVDDCLQSVEILWTPEDRSETLSMRDVVADYPELLSV